MKKLNVILQGGFGNQMFIYAFAKAYAERHGMELCCGPWVGEKLFQLDHSPAQPELPEINEPLILDPERDPNRSVSIRGYFQQQAALIYTRTDVRRWFTFRAEVENFLYYRQRPRLDSLRWQRVCAHHRVGDYLGYGYVVPSRISYEHTCAKFHLCSSMADIHWVTQEKPWTIDGLDPELAFLPDFYRMMTCDTLLRGNSTFSWWASVLTYSKCHRVFSPIINGLEGGREHDVEFIEGNWPRFANLPFVTDLHLQP